MSQNTGLIIFFVVLAAIFIIVTLSAIVGVAQRNKMGRPVTHATYGNNLDNANLDGSNGTTPQQLSQNGVNNEARPNSPTGTGTNKSGNVPGNYRS